MFRGRITVSLLICLVLLSGFFVAGCGGGGQSEDQSQGDGNSEENADQEKKTPKSKIALGRVVSVNTEAKRINVRPSTAEQGKEPIPFRLTPKARIRLDGEVVDLDAVERGQQVQMEYVTRKDLNRALSVELFSASGGETTG